MKKISIDAFLREYSVVTKQKGTAMETFMKKHIVTDYIGFIQKSVICDSIVKATCYAKEGDIEFVHINSANINLFFEMKIIDLYTDIEINVSEGNLAEQYDKLNKVGAVENILECVPEDEYAEFNALLKMKLNDFRDNEYSITALLYNLKKSFALSSDTIGAAIEEVLKEIENSEEK